MDIFYPMTSRNIIIVLFYVVGFKEIFICHFVILIFFFKIEFLQNINNRISNDYNIEKDNYYIATCHRRENVHEEENFNAIVKFFSDSPYSIYFPVSYRTQKILKKREIKLPKHIIMVDPIGYEELLVLMVNSRGVLTDSGTIAEETCILQIPTINIRISSERPQVYDAGGCIKFDPANSSAYPSKLIYKKLESLRGKKWSHPFGDGKSSERIANDLIKRVLEGRLKGHIPKDYHFPINHAYKEDEIKL